MSTPLLKWALNKALGNMEGNQTRWTKRRSRGLTDKELGEAIEYEFGTHFGLAINGLWLDCKGKTNPKFEITRIGGRILERPFVLTGKRLLDAARKLKRIPFPQGEVQSVQLLLNLKGCP